MLPLIINDNLFDAAGIRCRYWRRRLGLVVRYSNYGSYRFCYSSRGTPGGATPTLLMLHGFSATKDMWLPIVKVTHTHTHRYRHTTLRNVRLCRRKKVSWSDGRRKLYTVLSVDHLSLSWVRLFSPPVSPQKPARGLRGHAGTRGDESHRGRGLLHSGPGPPNPPGLYE